MKGRDNYKLTSMADDAEGPPVRTPCVSSPSARAMYPHSKQRPLAPHARLAPSVCPMASQGVFLTIPLPPHTHTHKPLPQSRFSFRNPACVLILAHLACVGTQTLFGGGSVVGKLGVSQGNPVLFALIREGTAGPILCIAAFVVNRLLPEAKHIPRFLILGACLFGNQLFFIVGLKLSNSITASVWQPTQPIFTCLVALLIRQEKFSVWKVGLGA